MVRYASLGIHMIENKLSVAMETAGIIDHSHTLQGQQAPHFLQMPFRNCLSVFCGTGNQ